MKQTRARIFHGNTHSKGKIVSVFEPPTEIIRKGKASKPTEFGKMVKFQEAENQIITAYEVYAARPYDSDLLIEAIDTHEAVLGRVPRLVAADAAFYSANNEAAAKSKGVKRVPDARGASASSNDDMASAAAATGGLSEWIAGSARRHCRQPHQYRRVMEQAAEP
jgi:hypothetical protein